MQTKPIDKITNEQKERALQYQIVNKREIKREQVQMKPLFEKKHFDK